VGGKPSRGRTSAIRTRIAIHLRTNDLGEAYSESELGSSACSASDKVTPQWVDKSYGVSRLCGGVGEIWRRPNPVRLSVTCGSHGSCAGNGQSRARQGTREFAQIGPLGQVVAPYAAVRLVPRAAVWLAWRQGTVRFTGSSRLRRVGATFGYARGRRPTRIVSRRVPRGDHSRSAGLRTPRPPRLRTCV
jgi:hypothetical protein